MFGCWYSSEVARVKGLEEVQTHGLSDTAVGIGDSSVQHSHHYRLDSLHCMRKDYFWTELDQFVEHIGLEEVGWEFKWVLECVHTG